jgi:hypothetical protein
MHLPFAGNDTTAGIENEIQTAVIGTADSADLPLAIKASSYYKNLLRRTASGDCSKKLIEGLTDYLEDDRVSVWENSWVRFALNLLNDYARRVLNRDLAADKTVTDGPPRGDCHRFLMDRGEPGALRIPVSYLLKLALADAIGGEKTDGMVRASGELAMEHFSNDNTSPETCSFYPVPTRYGAGLGMGVVKETAKRFLLCQLLTEYANQKFRLTQTGQRTVVYFAPNPPYRQRLLNNLIPDAFYRELFMSPCLSGWRCGEDKYRYMVKCHQVLSRSQLNALHKLKDANIIVNNLVVLPNTSNVSLANNGTHISLGSRKLTRLLKDPGSGFGPADEKYLGDLVIKIMEHFLPLFVGTYSAAPYRFDFQDFHPEKMLGFLPHELDYTHLRMLWRRWKKKASLKLFGHPVTPFGPEWLDRLLSRVCGLKGDTVCDLRLLDYFVSVLSTDENPALNGELNNEVGLKQDLANMGVFDTEMPLYLLYRLRQCRQMGFSGFEGRYYSLFESLTGDMSRAVELQTLLTALAYKYILAGTVSHEDIPDSPTIESERRQFFFGAAIGIPTFYVHKKTQNRFLLKILRHARHTRASRRYPDYVRVHHSAYQMALIHMLKEDASDLLELFHAAPLVEDLENRLLHADECSAAGKMTRRILSDFGVSDPLKVDALAFNTRSETIFREQLLRKHVNEAFDLLLDDVRVLDSFDSWRHGAYNKSLLSILAAGNAGDFVQAGRRDFHAGEIQLETVQKLIHLCLLTIDHDRRQSEKVINL